MSVPPGAAQTSGSSGEGEAIQAHPTSPRSLRVHEAALQATRELLKESGLGAATVDAIAARSGVSKATIYKHWPSRTAVAAEAFGSLMSEALPLPDTGSTVGDITEHLRQVSAFYDAEPVFAQLLAACVTDPGAAPYFRRFFLTGHREAIATLWQRALDRGEADPDIDAETATDILFGPLIFRLMSGHHPLTEAAADKIAAAALGGLLVTS